MGEGVIQNPVHALKEKALGGFFWVFLQRGAVQAFQFFIKILLARILLPNDFGLVASALLVIGTFDLFASFGIAEALIQKKYLSQRHLHTAFTLIFGFGILFTGIMFFSADLWASFFSSQELIPLIQFFSLSFMINAVALLPSTLLDKEMDFRKKIVPEVFPVLVYFGVSYVLALQGYGAWSIAIAYILNQLIRSLLYLLLSSYKAHLFIDLSFLQSIMHYGKEVVFANILTFFVLQLDYFVVGRMLGTESLGFYTMAYTFASLLAVSIAPIIRQVMFSLYAKVQEKKEALQKSYLMTLQMSAVLIYPASAGIFLLAPYLPQSLLGLEWSAIVLPLQILCIAAIFRVLGSMSGVLFNAIGKPHLNRNIGILQLVLLAGIIYPFTVSLGLVGTSMSVFVAMAITFVVALWYSCKYLDLALRKGLLQLATALLPTLCMYLSLDLLLSFFDIVHLGHLLLVIALGILLYVFFLYLFERSVFSRYFHLTRETLTLILRKNI